MRFQCKCRLDGLRKPVIIGDFNARVGHITKTTQFEENTRNSSGFKSVWIAI